MGKEAEKITTFHLAGYLEFYYELHATGAITQRKSRGFLRAGGNWYAKRKEC
jgi:hypothetical protein